MGNQGTKNWKLTALFAISLMLIAGLFTNAAIAADGDGTVSVMWNHDEHDISALFRDDGALTYKGTLYEWLGTNPTGAIWNPLPAGSTENQLMFSYHVDTNMAGGQVKFDLPAGWKILTTAANVFGIGVDGTVQTIANDSFDEDAYGRYEGNLLIEILEDFDGIDGEDVATTIYRQRRDGKTVDGDGAVLAEITPVTPEAQALIDAAARVTIAETSVTVDLSNDWRSGGELVVVLRNVQTAIPRSLSSTTGGTPDLPYYNYPIVVSFQEVWSSRSVGSYPHQSRWKR